MSLEEVSRHLWPFWLTMLILVMLITFIPPLAMTIPTWARFSAAAICEISEFGSMNAPDVDRQPQTGQTQSEVPRRS